MIKNNQIKIKLSLVVAILITTVVIAQTAPKQVGDYYHYPKLTKELLDVNLAKNKLKDFILKNKYIRIYNNGETSNFMVKEVLIYDDRFEFIKGKNKISVTFQDITDGNIIYKPVADLALAQK